MAIRYIMTQAIALRDNFAITNEAGIPMFTVRSNFRIVRKKFSICDINGNEFFFLQERAMNNNMFDIYPNEANASGKTRIGTVQKRGTFRSKFIAKTTFGKFVAKGKFGHSFTFTIEKDGNLAATISKKVIQITDSYAIDVESPADSPIILALALAIDEIHYGAKQKKNNAQTASSTASSVAKTIGKLRK